MLHFLHLGNVLVFVLEGNIACTRFLLAWNLFVGSMLVFMLHVKIACVKFILPCDVVIGNVIVFVIEVVLDFFSMQCCCWKYAFVYSRSISNRLDLFHPTILLCAFVYAMRKSNMCYIFFILQCCYWQHASILARRNIACTRFLFHYNLVVGNMLLFVLEVNITMC